jgi:hypothetical protein
MCQTWAANGHVELGDLDYLLAQINQKTSAFPPVLRGDLQDLRMNPLW